MALELTDSNFDSEIMQSDKLALVDFWASWCGPCRTLAPVIDELAKDYAGKVIVGKVNIETNSILTNKFEIKTIPTILVIKKGKILERLMGSRPKSYFVEAIERHMF